MTQRPTIIILLPTFGLVERGAEVFTSDFILHLQKDFSVVVYTHARNFLDTIHISSPAYLLTLINKFSKIHPRIAKLLDRLFLNSEGADDLVFAIYIFPFLLFNHYDIIFSQAGPWTMMACRFIRFLRKKPIVYRSGGGKEPFLIRQKPDLCIATTPSLYTWIKTYRQDSHVVYIPNGIDLQLFSSDIKSLHLQFPKPVFLTVAALIPAKRIDLTIAAVAELKKGSLIIAGSGPLYKKLQAVGMKMLGEKRFSIISLPHLKIPSLYTSCDYFTLASRDEPFGIVYLEALACGLPIVTTDDESRRHIVGDAGLFCEPLRIDEYSKTLEKALQKDFSNIPQMQAQKFNWVKIAAQYKKELKKLII